MLSKVVVGWARKKRYKRGRNGHIGKVSRNGGGGKRNVRFSENFAFVLNGLDDP